MKRQTRLTPAEGGKFAGPIGTPVPPNAADMGRATDEQVEAANGTMRRLDQTEKVRRLRGEVDMLKRAALGDSEMIEHLRDQNAALVKEVQETRVQRDILAAWKSHRLACDVKLSDEAWTVMREATGRANPPPRYRGVPIISDDSVPGSRTIYAVPDPDVLPTHGISLAEAAQQFFDNYDKGLDCRGRPRVDGASITGVAVDEFDEFGRIGPCPDCGKSPCCYESKCALPF